MKILESEPNFLFNSQFTQQLWTLITTIMLCIMISSLTGYLFFANGYCFSFLLGMAFGIAATAATWLIYGLYHRRRK